MRDDRRRTIDTSLILSSFRLLFASYHGFYRSDSQHGKGQYIKNGNLAQVEDTVKMDIEIEWNRDDDD